jgi:hypothetical protein
MNLKARVMPSTNLNMEECIYYSERVKDYRTLLSNLIFETVAFLPSTPSIPASNTKLYNTSALQLAE